MMGEQKQKTVASAEKQENQDLAEETTGKKDENIINEETNTNEEKVIESDHEESDETVEELKLKIEQIKKEKDQTYERMLRIQAEYENFKKRTQREKLAERKYKSQDLANELLPALDNFERALAIETTEETESIVEGISMVYRQIKDALQAEGIEEIETVGKQFDPNLHHAVMQVEDENKESNIIIEELQKGYILSDRVIRPAMVKVNK